MDEDMANRPGDDFEALEAAATERLERLHTRPELRALIAEIQRDLDPEEAARIENDARREKLAMEVVRVPAQRVAVATAKVILAQTNRPLEEVARDAGLALDDFKKLDSGSPKARTQIALRVIDQIDAIYRKADKTLGGTARLPRPHDVEAKAEAAEAGRAPAPRRDEEPSSPTPAEGPASGRNITGTEILPAPAEVKEVKKGITGTERLEVPEEVRSHPRNVTGTARLDPPEELSRRAPPPSPLPSPLWLAAVVAILVAVVLLAVFR